jgi:hypothetical protein
MLPIRFRRHPERLRILIHFLSEQRRLRLVVFLLQQLTLERLALGGEGALLVRGHG